MDFYSSRFVIAMFVCYKLHMEYPEYNQGFTQTTSLKGLVLILYPVEVAANVAVLKDVKQSLDRESE